MVDNNRRKMLKATGTAIGLSAIPTTAAGQSGKDDEEIEIHDKTTIVEEEDKTIIGVDLEKKQGGGSGSRRRTNSSGASADDGSRSRIICTVENEGGAVSLAEVGPQQYESLTGDGVSALSAKQQVEALDAHHEVVERSDVYSQNSGSCDAYNYTHKWAAVTAEFTDEAGDLSWATISAALIALVGASSLSGGAAAVLVAAITLVGGLAAIITDTYELTFAGDEWDQNLWSWTQTMYSARAAPGYHRDKGELTTITIAPTHPAR